MHRKSESLLSDIHMFCAYVVEFTRGLSFDAYLQQPIVRHAVERNLHTLGEATIRLQRLDPALAASIPDADKIVGLRHRLAHGYLEDIDDEIIWEAATLSIPKLQSWVSALLREHER